MKLILIEGIAGSGKSTVGQKLVKILYANNISAGFFHEFDRMNPIRELNFKDSNELIEKTIAHWRTFVDEHQSPNISIFDGILSQCFVAELMLMCTDEQTIIDGVRKVIETIEVLDPRVIYLYQDNIGEAILKAYNERNETWQKKIDTFIANTPYGEKEKLEGLSGYIVFNQMYSPFLSRIMEDSNVTCLSIETSQGKWTTYYKQITEFLSIPLFENNSIKTLSR